MKRIKGMYFDPASWDGSDVFMTPDKGFIFVTGRVKDALDAAGVSNAAYESLDDILRRVL